MLLTEEEAKKKVCLNSVFCSDSMPSVCTCIVSSCMAWRWSKESGISQAAQFHRERLGCDLVEAYDYVKKDPETALAEAGVHARRGYCGLAGKPKEER